MDDLTVVVVAYFAAEALGRALSPLRSRLPVIVVDNSSDSGVANATRDAGATYVDAKGNVGFGAGVNIALRDAVPATHDVLLLNPDAVIGVDDIALLAEALRADCGLAAVSPALVDVDGLAQRVLWPFPSPGRAWLEAMRLRRPLQRHEDFAVGAVLMLKRAAVTDVGLFDERFFLYAEEVDWQRRAAARGWRIAAIPSATAFHEGAGTSSDEERRELVFHAAHETYIRKWFGSAGWLLYRIAVIVGALPRAVLAARDQRAGARRRLRIYLRGPAISAERRGAVPRRERCQNQPDASSR